MSYQVSLQKFEGPLGLLLYLIRKEEMSILDIDVHLITQQYLDYLKLMKEFDLEVASEFIAMAATLIHIKSRMLLPQYNEQGEEVEVEDPRRELVSRLLEYQRFQDAGKRLYDRPLLRRDVWPSGLEEPVVGQLIDDIIVDEKGLFALISSYRKALKMMKKAVHRVYDKTQSIASRIMEIKSFLKIGSRVELSKLINHGPTARFQLLITFLSLLELGRMGFVSLFQNEVYGEIYVETKTEIDRNVLERVQEFDAADSEQVANQILADAEQEAIEESEEIQVEQVVEEDAAGSGSDLMMASDDEILRAEEELNLVENTERTHDDNESMA